MAANHLHIVGFGSQASAWAEILRASGWNIDVYLANSEGPSFAKARALGHIPRLTHELRARLAAPNSSDSPALIAMLLPDHLIGALYREELASLATPLTMVLAHGYAVYANELDDLRPGHEAALLAPKAIGPKLLEAACHSAPRPHRLVAAFGASNSRQASLRALARGLGFADENLVQATFEQEAIGDLVSEQSLLCGGVFTLLEWTMESMSRVGVPDRLIREECLTELELIAGLLRERGPADAFTAISQAAQAGTIAMAERFEKAGVRREIDAQADDVVSKRFDTFMRRAAWRQARTDLIKRLSAWQARLVSPQEKR